MADPRGLSDCSYSAVASTSQGGMTGRSLRPSRQRKANAPPHRLFTNAASQETKITSDARICLTACAWQGLAKPRRPIAAEAVPLRRSLPSVVSERLHGSCCVATIPSGPASEATSHMARARALRISLTSLFVAAAVALVLRSSPLSPRRPWEPIGTAAECPPAWRLDTADRAPAGKDSYEQCLARHGRTLHSGYSLQ